VTSFVLIPGAGGSAWYWHRVVPLLREAGHEAIAVDLPGDDEAAGLPEYASLVTGAIGGRDDVVLVAQSLGAFTAPLAAARSGVRALVFVNAMIPVPGETPGAWWGNTGWEQARIDAALAGGYRPEFDLDTYFLHDVPPEVADAGLPYQRPDLPGRLPAEAGRRPARRPGRPAARRPSHRAGRAHRAGRLPARPLARGGWPFGQLSCRAQPVSAAANVVTSPDAEASRTITALRAGQYCLRSRP